MQPAAKITRLLRIFAPVKCPSINMAKTTKAKEPTAANLCPYTPIREKNIPNTTISKSTSGIIPLTKLAINATTTKQKMAKVSEFLRLMNGPG